MKTKVLQDLKPKAASLGFTAEELESVATQIAGTLQEDATEEQISAQVDAIMPYLKLSQSAVTRIVNAKKKEKKTPQAPDTSEPKEVEKGANPEDKFEKLFKIIEAQNAKIDSLVNKDKKESRKNIYAAKLKTLPSEIQKTKLKDFERMNFENDEDFDSFVSEVENDVQSILQELSDKELGEMGKPIKGGAVSKEASDEEIKKIIDKMDL
jgi:DNA-binding MarR family transcriptional regulator